jgi:predicted ATPase
VIADNRLVRRVSRTPSTEVDPRAWPYTLAPVAQLLEQGLDLAPGVTFLVGENGSGKSTLVEALASALEINAQGGSKMSANATRATESDLGDQLGVTYGVAGRSCWSYFLRAETMHDLYTYLEDNPGGPGEPAFHELSHGESFLEVLSSRFRGQGFYLMDEPESALSFRSCLTLLTVLDDLRSHGSQVVVATHSPLLVSLPGATLLEVGEHGIRQVAYDDLQVVRDWRSFLDAPGRWLRHLLDGDAS